MHTPPEGLDVGDQLSQDDIEKAFNTGFGYRISGINPRRDDNNNRYILVFANEDGPYDDSVRQGQFEYIGEGLKGDQSESSPGNSTLIDAVSSDIPVYFFYKGQEAQGWEYQGEIEVEGYRREVRGGREVFIFSMKQMTKPIPGLYLVPINEDWIDDFRRTVMAPLKSLKASFLSEKEQERLSQEKLERRVWGTTETNSAKKQAAIDQMEGGDIALFYYDGDFIAGGKIDGVYEEDLTGRLLWSEPRSKYIYHIREFTTQVAPINDVWDYLGYEGRKVVQGFTRVAEDRLSKIVGEYGSLESVLFGDDVVKPSKEEIEREKSELTRSLDSEPQLIESTTQYTQTRRVARDRAFSEMVRQEYENTCAVCGSQRESPEGDPEVEAAHIYPKSKGGSDDIRNGIALCKLHHWAFDSGWLSFTDDHEVIVAEAPDKNGYDEFEQVDGQTLRLPEDEETYPHPLFAEAHRDIHGFEH